MKNTTAFKRYVVATAISVVGMLATSMAQADTVICPDPMVVVLGANGKPTNESQDRQYQTTSAVDCVWGNGNIGGNANQDNFLLVHGTNDALYGTPATALPTFGLNWTKIDKVDAVGGIQGSLIGLTINGSNDTTDYFEWTLTHTTFDRYALGLVDGGDPKWAVFLLTDGAISGIAEIISAGGSWSHVVLYGAYEDGSPPPEEIPEPGTLALVGLALLGGAALRRRKV